MPSEPRWYTKPIPAGLLISVLSLVLGAGAAGGVGIATRDGDLSAVEARIDAKVAAAVEQLRREEAAAHRAQEELSATRYDEILRRLDRIERQLDDPPSGGAGR